MDLFDVQKDARRTLTILFHCVSFISVGLGFLSLFTMREGVVDHSEASLYSPVECKSCDSAEKGDKLSFCRECLSFFLAKEFGSWRCPDEPE